LYWRITVSNRGDVAVHGIRLQDLNEPSCETAAGTFDLEVGAHKNVYCSTSNVTGDFTNVATAVFVPEGQPVEEPPVVTQPDSAGGHPRQPEPGPGHGASTQTGFSVVPLAQTGFSIVPLGVLGVVVVLFGLLLVRRTTKRKR
jgi:hypothetical protein